MTIGGWTTLAFIVVGVSIGVSALRRDRRWLALWCGVLVAQSIVQFFLTDSMRPLRSLIGIPVLLVFFLTWKQLRAEAERTRPRRAETGRERAR